MMNATMPALIGGLGTQEMIIILLIVVVLFGASRLPQLAKALARASARSAKAWTRPTKRPRARN